MSGPRIVIVTYNWPPRNAIGTHRPYAWARYWSAAGAKVTVLTAVKQSFDAPLDLHMPHLQGVEVIEVPYGGGAGLIQEVLRSDRLRRIASQAKAWVGRYSSRVIDPRATWHKAALPIAERLARSADIVVSTYGPAATHLIAYDMKIANPALRWVADYRDLWSQRHNSDMPESARSAIRAQEAQTVWSHADLLTAVSDDLVRQLGESSNKRVVRIFNGFDIDDADLRQSVSGPLEKPILPFRIVYTGMLYEGSRDPEPLLAALAKLTSSGRFPEGAITVDFYGARVEPARRLARQPQYAPFIRLMGHVPRNIALSAQREAGLLLLLESPAPEARGVLTGKLFEYITAGRPILCLGSLPEYELGQVLAATGTGMVLGPERYGDIGAVIQCTLDGAGLYTHYRPDITAIKTFSRARQSLIMFDLIYELLNRKAA